MRFARSTSTYVTGFQSRIWTVELARILPRARALHATRLTSSWRLRKRPRLNQAPQACP
jgi:hypothetical protein